MKTKINIYAMFVIMATMFIGCAGKSAASGETESSGSPATARVAFEGDSAYFFVAAQTRFGARVPGTEAHRTCALWLEKTLENFGAEVHTQQASLRGFDGVMLPAVNIFGRFNPEATERTLLVAHWDSRPWADNDPDESKHKEPVMGANDGASGVGVILEIARLASIKSPTRGIDILFVDAEDRGTHSDDQSWALGSRYYVSHIIPEGYIPTEVILLDMVGGKDAKFHREYFSQQSAGWLVDKIWSIAAKSGYSSRFIDEMGGAVTDDHVEFIRAGIPAIDIIEFNPDSDSGFNPTWHTTTDTLENIDKESLTAVGQTLVNYLF